jgi:hypothetical protein
MFRLTLHYTYHPEEGNNPPDFVGRGNTLSEACQDLIREAEEFFGVDADASIWEGCAEIMKDSEVFEYHEMGNPPASYTLMVEESEEEDEDHEVAPRDHNCPVCKLEMERAASDVPEIAFGNTPPVE